MKVKRLLGSLAAAGTLTAFSLGFAAPALAVSTSVTFNYNNGQQIQQTPGAPLNVQVTASCTTALCSFSSFSVSIGGPDPVAAISHSNKSSPDTITLSWDTGPTTKHNGQYTINASATEAGLTGGTYNDSRNVLVNNPPAAPANVKAALDSGNVPVVTWNANSEPDVTGYEVFRSGDSSSAAAFTTNATNFRDTGAPAGKALSYIVVAVRTSPVWQSGITSCNGQAPCPNPPTSQATTAVTVPAPPAAAPAPASIATADPPPAPKTAAGSAATTPPKAAIGFSSTAPIPINGPSLPTQIVQLPAPNVIQFAPLLPYSGKIPEVASTQTVPAPVQAVQTEEAPPQETLALPGGVRVTPVDAVKYMATAAFLIVAAVHLTRFARKLKNAPV